MNRVNFGKVSGAVGLDVCKGHGTFLDRGELHQIVTGSSRVAGSIGLAPSIARRSWRRRRRLQDVERMHARVAPSDGGASGVNDASFRALLSALLGH